MKSDRGDDGGNVNSKRIVATWVVGLGEEASHIQIVPPITKDIPSGIIILGRRTLYMLQDTGVLTFSRKLDFCATSLRAFRPSRFLFLMIYFICSINFIYYLLSLLLLHYHLLLFDISSAWTRKNIEPHLN